MDDYLYLGVTIGAPDRFFIFMLHLITFTARAFISFVSSFWLVITINPRLNNTKN